MYTLDAGKLLADYVRRDDENHIYLGENSLLEPESPLGQAVRLFEKVDKEKIYNKIEALFDEVEPIIIESQGVEVKIIYVQKMSPRHHFFQHALEIGKDVVEHLFDNKPLTTVEKNPYGRILVYPERWMNFSETRKFTSLLYINTCIITSSFEIIASVNQNENIKTLNEILP